MNGLLNFKYYGVDQTTLALLLIHPLGADLEFWDECVTIWSAQIPCIAVDLRSAGSSPMASAPLSICEHVADLEALRAELKIQSVVPVGCAIGAMVAAVYAAMHPDRISALILSNPTVRTSQQAKTNLSERSVLVRRHGMTGILPGAVDRAFLEQPRDHRYDRYLKKFASQNAEAYALSAIGVLHADISSELGAVRCPTLVVAGGHDVLLPPVEAKAVHALVRNAKYAELAEAAHFPPLQKPQEFTALVVDFLRDVGKLGSTMSA